MPQTPSDAVAPAGTSTGQPAKAAGKRSRRRTWRVGGLAVLLVMCGGGAAIGALYVDTVPPPDELVLPESTTLYYADGKTPMAKLGTENRTILAYEQMNDAVKQAIVAAEDRTFWTNEGIDFRGVMRAAWNNVTGGDRQGASTITQQYARIAADLKGVTYSRKLREAVMAWKLDDEHSKEEILGFYLNTVPFGRGAYGIEAAAQAFFGKTARKDASRESQLMPSEAAVLAAMVKQPEANPDDPEGQPGYDPKRNDKARQNSIDRWRYIRDGMVALGYLTAAEGADLAYPDTVRDYDPRAGQSGLDRPTGLVVNHVLSELRGTEPFKDRPFDYVRNGGFRIVTTVDKRAQDAAEAAANIRGEKAPEVVRGQPKNWQSALVAVEPGSGRVLAYYGGDDGLGADYAGWYFDDEGNAAGFGQHPPGSSFKVYDLAEAVRQDISPKQRFDSPATKEFPKSGRTRDTAAGPIRNSGSAACQPECTLWEATVASLNTTYFALTEQLGVPAVIDMARKAGVESMWANERGKPEPVRVALGETDAASRFSTEVGIGQYGITVQDHANGMATFAAGGERAQSHFVRSVSKGDDKIYEEQLTRTDVGLNAEQANQLNWTLRRVEAAKVPGWDAAGKTGTWQAGKSTTQNQHAWMVGYTGAIAAAVWLGTKDGKPLRTKDGSYDVFGASHPGRIWQQFMTDAAKAMELNPDDYRFGEPKFPGETPSAPPSAETPAPPTASPEPADTPRPTPSTEPTPEPEPTRTPKPTPSTRPTTPPAPREVAPRA
ncbi:penicillin-binding protein [Asanoa ishikariensis]|uniref:Membrane carboxypeptidase (Penicillin-binding protein) n=1 Tax=Asanoa ishikariensis TaxID=137265 RepID=A0A1H3NQM0_9ACTN|nr:transglycosylase domain-containing protein [Asanoa ishikariensis]GIF68484.1 penicillin-binding protein [Asanoa ishikariensis]SDY90469.1 Membrane carboxypeptidase (penicillin-binding protein) [Asanoa ishikariensis]